ncbi:MAG TPA: c-type cytochrome domain-containing protein [Fimbriiglobus sp.]|nr:c-type cytochrome domain-containing protein [Fimbriiglobus sp.]
MRVLFVALVAFGFASRLTAADDELARKARRIFEANCHRCHGRDGAVEGGLNYVTDLGKLVARKKVVPGKPDGSRLFRRLDDGSMPPEGENPRPSADDVAVIRKWIAAGAPGDPTSAVRKPISSADVQDLGLADLEKFDRRARRFQRYFTLAHLHNAGLGDDELQTFRNALSKLVNSLSWHPTVRVPEPIDPAKTVLRIDLRWYSWDASTWNRVLGEYPYGVLDDSVTARAVVVGTATKMPIVRGDWFVATASRAPLYYDLLQVPQNLAELERQLRVDAEADIRQDRVARVGFNGSGVSRFNRVLERHPSVHGAYWRTYDFDEPPANLIDRAAGTLLPDRRNIFAFPLGPGLVERPFQHAGGEAIFELPNGLHGYIVVRADNTRLDKGATAIVSDPRRPDRAVEAGVSCMSCHLTGINPKADQVRDHLAKNPKAFTRADAELIRGLYPPKEKSLKLMAEDAKRYTAAVAKAGAKVGRTEAVSTITLRYEADLDLPQAAAEVGLTADEFGLRVGESATLAKHFGALRAPGGTVSRQIWVQAFGDAVRELQLGTLFQANLLGAQLGDNTGEADPLEAPGDVANAVAFSADGRRALIASADRSVRLWDVEGRRDVRRLIGHTASVWAVAFSPDGSKAISGGMDGSVRVWDLATGSELSKLDGHLGLVSAVAFSPDGAKAISGGYDGSVVWWDVATGRELRRLDGEAKSVHAVALHPSRPLAAVAADRSVILWDTATGDVVKRWSAHDAAVTCVRFAEGGALLLTGGDDGRVRVWDATDGALRATLDGHRGGVRGLALKPGGRWLLSASADRTVWLWDLTAKKEVAVFRKHAAPVLAVEWLPSGVQTLSGDRDLKTLIWDVKKFLTGPALPDKIPIAK